LETSIRQHQVMIQLLRERDNWALAQLCVEHMQFSKFDYLDRIVARSGTDSSRRADDRSVLRHAGRTGKH
jgi:DNA-binding GntR family transcriptional regulator